jgi:hypothetical protein
MKNTILLAAAMLLFAVSASAYDFTDTTSSNHVLQYNITSNTAPYTVKVVGEGFYNFNNEHVVIPDTVWHNGTAYLVTEIGYQAFYGAYMSQVTIPNSVKSFGDAAFLGSAVQIINIGSGLARIGDVCFAETELLKEINVDTTNQHFKSLDGVLFNRNMDTLFFYPSDKPDVSYSIPSTVRVLFGNEYSATFDYNNHLTSVFIPASVAVIPPSCFSFISTLATITVDSANTTYKSHDGVLFNYDMDTLIQCPEARVINFYDIPTTVKHIGTYSFVSSNLPSITIPNSVLSIGNFAFADSRITSLVIGASVDTIMDEAFSSTDYLSDITSLSANAPKIDRLVFISLSGNWLYKNLHVPCGSSQNYLSNASWAMYLDTVHMQIFEDCQYHSITVDADTAYGTVVASTYSAKLGDTVVISITPNSGYHTYDRSVFKSTDPLVRVSVANDTLIMPNYDITIAAGFASLSIESAEAPKIEIYPNPAANSVRLSSEALIEHVELFNAAGVVVMKETVNNTNATLNVGKLNNGIYALRVRTKNGTSVKRLVISR